MPRLTVEGTPAVDVAEGTRLVIAIEKDAGVDIVGPLPGQFQNATSYRGVVPLAAKEKDAAHAFLQFLREPASASVYRSKGLQASVPVGVVTAAAKPEINALITTAMKAAIDELLPRFERESGLKVNITYGPSGGLAKRLAGGQAADLIILGSNELGELAKQGKVVGAITSVASTDRYQFGGGETEMTPCFVNEV